MREPQLNGAELLRLIERARHVSGDGKASGVLIGCVIVEYHREGGDLRRLLAMVESVWREAFGALPS